MSRTVLLFFHQPTCPCTSDQHHTKTQMAVHREKHKWEPLMNPYHYWVVVAWHLLRTVSTKSYQCKIMSNQSKWSKKKLWHAFTCEGNGSLAWEALTCSHQLNFVKQGVRDSFSCVKKSFSCQCREWSARVLKNAMVEGKGMVIHILIRKIDHLFHWIVTEFSLNLLNFLRSITQNAHAPTKI